jgi:hypothetical protein
MPVFSKDVLGKPMAFVTGERGGGVTIAATLWIRCNNADPVASARGAS